MDNFYYACLYDVLQNPEHRATRTEKVNRLKAQLIKAYRERAAAGMIEMQSLDSFQGEKISLFHIIKRRMRREKRTITQVTDQNGTKHTSPTAIIETFLAHFEKKIPKNTGGRSVCQNHGGGRSSTPARGHERDT